MDMEQNADAIKSKQCGEHELRQLHHLVGDCANLCYHPHLGKTKKQKEEWN